VGLLLIVISLGLYIGGMFLHTLFVFLALLGGVVPSGLSLVTGILGLANWIIGLIGLGLCIGGPPRIRGLTIAALAVAAVHLILALIAVNDNDSFTGSNISVPVLSGLNRAVAYQDLQKELQKEFQKNPGSARSKELQEELKSYEKEGSDGGILFGEGSSRSKMRWGDLVSLQTAFEKLIEILSYENKAFSKYLLSMFCGMAELARAILLILVIGSLAGVAKHYNAQSKAKIGWISVASVAGAALLIFLLCHVIADSGTKDAKKAFEDGFSSLRAPFRWLGVAEFLVFALQAGALVLPALAAWQVYSSTGTPKSARPDRKRTRRPEDEDDDDRGDRRRKRRRDDEDDD